MPFLKRNPVHDDVESETWDEDIAGPLARRLSEAYTSTRVPDDIYSRIESAVRMEAILPGRG